METRITPPQSDRFTQALERQKTLESVKTKYCTCCGRELPVEEFYTTKETHDGYYHICKKCKCEQTRQHNRSVKKLKEEIDTLKKQTALDLSTFTPRQLLDELARRGYKGELTYVQHIKL